MNNLLSTVFPSMTNCSLIKKYILIAYNYYSYGFLQIGVCIVSKLKVWNSHKTRLVLSFKLIMTLDILIKITLVYTAFRNLSTNDTAKENMES